MFDEKYLTQLKVRRKVKPCPFISTIQWGKILAFITQTQRLKHQKSTMTMEKHIQNEM